ncbi:MAG: hypothetical protein ACLF0G_13950 [Candidatus Brocadiia bacterium]
MRPLCALLLLLAAPLAGADEVAALFEKLDPPARFADHQARFTVEKRPFTFHHVEGPRTETWRVVKDGERVVALLTPKGTWHLLAFRPSEAPETLRMPTGRWHIDTLLGTLMATDAFIGEKTSDETFRFQGLGTDALTLVRRYTGQRTISRRRRNRKPGESKYEKITQKLDTTNTFVLRCDPVHGYTIEGTFDAAVSPKPTEKQYVNLMAQGTYDLWPGRATSYRTVFTPQGKPGYEGWANNLKAIDLSDNHRPVIRDGGFSAYLDDQTGWSACMTLEGRPARVAICNAHADVDNIVQWPEEMEPDERGLYRLVVRHRLLALPPEITGHLWDQMRLYFEGVEAVTVRIGVPEDFEDQPVPATSRVRGLINTGGLELSTEHARSGTQSLVVEGTVWPNLPQVHLLPRSRYRLEAWMMSPDPQVKLFITGHLYEWSPHSRKWLVEQQTNAVRGGKGWQRVALEFTTPEWDPFINIVFHAEGGQGYVDDFCLKKLAR